MQAEAALLMAEQYLHGVPHLWVGIDLIHQELVAGCIAITEIKLHLWTKA